MFGMTNDQLMGIVRQIVPILGTLATSFGWLSATQVTGITSIVYQIAGPALLLVGIVWSLIANSKTSILTAAANIPELAKPIEVTDRNLAAAVPSANVIAAKP